MVKAVSGIHSDAALICAFSVMLSKPLMSESRAFVTHTEGQSDESVYFQMHEKTSPRAQQSKRREFHTADD